MKKLSFLPILLIFSILITLPSFAAEPYEDTLELSAKSACLMELNTGRIIYDKNMDESLPPASVTKVMTMLLAMEALDSGKISLSDTVYCSEYAASMGGSQVYLEPGEAMTVDELLKAIAVASGNDACVMLGEHISGSIDSFISLMNEKAESLNMTATHFANATGLPDDSHYSSAHDIAIMSAELLKHEKIFDYSTIWMDSLRDGNFSLANTNKLLKQYSGANGLKTGSTDAALYCISATAKRDDMQLIAVVLGAETSEKRFNDAKILLDYGFANYRSITLYPENPPEITVLKGKKDTLSADISEGASFLIPKGKQESAEKVNELPDSLKAPIKKGDIIGKTNIYIDGELLGYIPIKSAEDIERAGFIFYFKKILSAIA